MADQKISELPAAALPLTGTELVAVVQGPDTERVPVSALGAQLARYRSGAWFGPQGDVQGNDSYEPVAGRLDAQPFFVWAPMRVQAIGQMGMNAGAGAGQQAKLAIYRAGQNGYPVGAPIYESAIINTPTSNGIVFDLIGLDFTLQPGMHFIVRQFNNSVVRMRRVDQGFCRTLWKSMVGGSDNPFSGSWGLSRTGITFGASFPAFSDASAEWTNINGPMDQNNFFALRAF